MGDVVEFGKAGLFSTSHDAVAKVADCDHNRDKRDGMGPAIGSLAWTCLNCGCFAFYITPKEFCCYECHNPQSFD